MTPGAVRQWLRRHRTARILIILALPTIALGYFFVQAIYTPPPTPQAGLIELEYEALAGPIRILESQWGTHRSGDFYQLHVLVDKESEFIPEEIHLLSQTDPEKVMKTLPLALNSDFECQSGLYRGYAGPAYETERLLTGRPLNQPWRRPQLPKGTTLKAFDLLLRDQAGSRILVRGIEPSGRCLSIFE